jgi:hypothetical protein
LERRLPFTGPPDRAEPCIIDPAGGKKAAQWLTLREGDCKTVKRTGHIAVRQAALTFCAVQNK